MVGTEISKYRCIGGIAGTVVVLLSSLLKSFRHLRSTLYGASDSDVFRGHRLPGIYMRKQLIRAGMVGIQIPKLPVPGTYLTYGACGRYHMGRVFQLVPNLPKFWENY